MRILLRRTKIALLLYRKSATRDQVPYSAEREGEHGKTKHFMITRLRENQERAFTLLLLVGERHT